MKEFFKKVWAWVKVNPAESLVSVMWTITTIMSFVGAVELFIEGHRDTGICVGLVTLLGYLATMSIVLQDVEKPEEKKDAEAE